MVIDHASAAPWSWQIDGRRPQFPAPAHTLARLFPGPGWEAEVCERAERVATGPGGQTAVVADNIIVLRRQ